MAGPHHRTAAYQRAAKRLVAAATLNPDTRCGRCGLPARPDDPWEAGHVRDGQINGPLRAEHASCNRSAGGKLGAERLAQRRARNVTTRAWLD